MVLRLIALSSLLILTGCEFYYGVSRYGALSQLPPPSCVEAVVRAAPGVNTIDVRHSKGGRPLKLTGLKPASDVHSYYYHGNDFEGQVLVEHRYDGSTTFHQMYGRFNSPVPQERVDTVLPVMAHIEAELARKCGFEPSRGELAQSCSRVKCTRD